MIPVYPIGATAVLLLGSLTMCLNASAGAGAGDDPVASPDAMQDSPAEQSAWLDQTIPKLTAAMHASKEVHAKVAGPLASEKAPPFPLTLAAVGIAPGDLERWSTLADAAIAANPRYGQGGKAESRPTVTVMPHTRIVRLEATYPAPPASKEFEPGPLTIDAWVCPDRATALALFWLRRWGLRWLNSDTPQTAASSVLKVDARCTPTKAKEGEPGESAYWDFPRLKVSVIQPKGHRPLHADRFSFLRGNVVVEASTVEFTWDEESKEWLAFKLDECVRDVEAVMRSIDAGLLRVQRK